MLTDKQFKELVKVYHTNRNLIMSLSSYERGDKAVPLDHLLTEMCGFNVGWNDLQIVMYCDFNRKYYDKAEAC